MVLFPIALIWVGAVLYFVIRRSLNEPGEPDEQSEQGPPPRFRRPPGGRPRDGRKADSARQDRTGSRSRPA